MPRAKKIPGPACTCEGVEHANTPEEIAWTRKLLKFFTDNEDDVQVELCLDQLDNDNCPAKPKKKKAKRKRPARLSPSNKGK